MASPNTDTLSNANAVEALKPKQAGTYDAASMIWDAEGSEAESEDLTSTHIKSHEALSQLLPH